MTLLSSDTLRLLSVLLDYPDDDLLDCLDRIASEAARLPESEVKTAIPGFLAYLSGCEPLLLRENFTAAFDLRPATTLNLTYHAFGDNEKRAAVLARLQHLFNQAGWERIGGELPDYLPLLLEFLSIHPRSWMEAPVRQCLQATTPLAENLKEAAPAYAALMRPLARLTATAGTDDQRVIAPA